MKRQRGRGRGGKPGGGGGQQYHHNNNQPNRTMESNGPEGKVRGPAALIYERYLQAARDATSSGDRILGENYLQHADHYFRLLRQMQPAVQHQPQADRFASGEEFEGEEDGAMDAEGVDEGAGEEGQQAEADGQSQRQPQQGQQGEDGELRRNRGRGRRTRFRPEGGEGEGAQAREEGGERREPRPPREPREPRAERDEGAREGFAGPGPKPAFLGSD